MLYFSGLFSNQVDLSVISKAAPSNEALPLSDIQMLLRKAPYYVAFFIAQLLTYVALFSESLTTVRYQKILLRIKDKSASEAIEQIPLWSFSFILMLGAGIISLFQLSTLSHQITATFSPTVLLTTSTLFVVRDIFIIHYFNFSTNIQRVLGASVIYLFLLYALIPSVLLALDLGHLNVMFIPSGGEHTLLALSAIIAQIGVIGYFCIRAAASKEQTYT